MYDKEQFYVGTNSVGESKGLYSMSINLVSGTISMNHTVQVYNSGVLLWQEGVDILYALSEGMTFLGKAEGGVISFQLKDDALILDSCGGTGGQRPCALALSSTRRELYVGNFFGGNIAVIQLDQSGKINIKKKILSIETDSGVTAGIHDIVNSPDDKYLLALEIREHAIHIYRKDDSNDAVIYSQYMGNDVFPRQMVFGRDGQTLYVVSQKKSEVFVYRWQPEEIQMLEHIQTISTLPKDYNGINAPSAIKISPNGRRLAVANRIFDHVTLYRVGEDGLLYETTYCPIRDRLPRDCTFSSDGKYLIVAGTASDTVSSYTVKEEKGILLWADTCSIPHPAAVTIGKGGEKWTIR